MAAHATVCFCSIFSPIGLSGQFPRKPWLAGLALALSTHIDVSWHTNSMGKKHSIMPVCQLLNQVLGLLHSQITVRLGTLVHFVITASTDKMSVFPDNFAQWLSHEDDAFDVHFALSWLVGETRV
jgi:hypothetical protein